VDFLERSIRLSNPSDSIVRKLYSLLAQSSRLMGNLEDATRFCQEGRKLYPQDPELLFQESIVLQKLGDYPAAIASLKQVVEGKDGSYFASVDAGLRGFKGHHNLAVLYQESGQPEEAENHWRIALGQEPGYLPSLIGLGYLYLKHARDVDLREVLRRLDNHPEGKRDGLLLRARKHLADREYSEALRLVDGIIQEYPQFLPAWITRSHILLQEGGDWQSAELALREILRRDPGNGEARKNLQVLRSQLSQQPS
jgi:tetratricopeptide (TPR) repeat protein